MKIINKLIEISKIRDIILVDNLKINLDKKNLNVFNVSDARSACFYAFGQSKITNQNIMLILDGNYLPSVYTSLTEAWFQKANIIVVALYNSIYDVEANYLNRCTVYNFKFFENDFEKFKGKIENSLNIIGPKLYNIILNDYSIERNSYKTIVETLNKFVKEDDTIIVYNGQDVNSKCNFINIDYKYKYGILTKYMAKTIINNKTNILICTEDCLSIDANIFNNRYMNERFKLIIVASKKYNEESYKIRQWIGANNINYKVSDNLKKDIENLYNKNEASILVVEEEK